MSTKKSKKIQNNKSQFQKPNEVTKEKAQKLYEREVEIKEEAKKLLINFVDSYLQNINFPTLYSLTNGKLTDKSINDYFQENSSDDDISIKSIEIYYAFINSSDSKYLISEIKEIIRKPIKYNNLITQFKTLFDGVSIPISTYFLLRGFTEEEADELLIEMEKNLNSMEPLIVELDGLGHESDVDSE